MDDVAIGRLLRSIRIRLGRRQVDVGARAGVSQQLVSLLETEGAAEVSLGALREIAGALGAEVVLTIRWRGADVDRLRDEDHARIVAVVAALLVAHGWLVQPEVTFAHFGERGSIDLLAFHPVTGALLVVEVKTDIASAEETLRRLDVKVRLAGRIAAERFGWRPRGVSRLMAVADSSTQRRRVARHDGVFGPVLPLRGWAARGWLGTPNGPAGLLLFLSPTRQAGARRGPATIRRVRASGPGTGRAGNGAP